MNLIRYNSPLNHTLAELSSWLREPANGFDPFRVFGDRFRDVVDGDSRLATDLLENDDAYQARFHLPGITRDEVSVRVEPENRLVVKFERKQKDDEGREVVAHASRRIALPEDAAADKVKAKLEHGVLTVTIEKTEARKPRQVEIA